MRDDMRGTEVSEFIDLTYTWQERAIKAEAKFTECRKAADVLQSEVGRLRKYGTIGRIAVTEIKRLRQELDKYKRAYAEICHQFNFGDEGDYKAMYDCWLDWAEKEGE